MSFLTRIISMIKERLNNNLNNKLKRNLKKNKTEIIRFIIQILFFIIAPSAFNVAFNGIKYVFIQVGLGEKIQLTTFVTGLLALLIYTCIFGRFFCGFACAFGSVSDWIYLISQKTQKLIKHRINLFSNQGVKVVAKIVEYVKYFILFGILILCYEGRWNSLSSFSPWEMFARLRAGEFGINANKIAIIILICIFIATAFIERFFCRFLCPMGAVFSLIPVLPIFNIFRNKGNCINGCSACSKRCPMQIDLPDDDSGDYDENCIQCLKCVSICPKENNHAQIKTIRGNEFWLIVIKVLILGLVMLFVKII